MADDDGWNALINASKKGHLPLVNRLLEAGATCDPTEKHSALRGFAFLYLNTYLYYQYIIHNV